MTSAVNQLALSFEAMGINVYDVRAGVASLKGEGITRAIFGPGAGAGGVVAVNCEGAQACG